MIRPPLLAAVLLALSACASAPRERPLQPFESEREWDRYQAWQRREAERLRRQAPPPQMIIEPPGYYLPPPPPAPGGTSPPAPAIPVSTRVHPASEADPGPLARVHGDYLIVLHRGRLFTVRMGRGELEPVSVVDAFGPDWEPLSSYDDLLVAGDHVVVVSLGGSSLGGARLGVFRLAPDGVLTYRDTYGLASAGEDFNGMRRHASRVVGDRLVFYSGLSPDQSERQAAFNEFPSLYRWSRSAYEAPVEPTRVHRPAAGHPGNTMHTVTSCALVDDDLRCQSTALYASWSERFYVSPTAVYLWAHHDERHWEESSVPRYVLYRMPLDGSAPTALRVAGRPADAFSFHESADGHINVLVHKDAGLALLRVPLAELGDGSRAAGEAWYRPLPRNPAGPLLRRFVGDWLVYGINAPAAAGSAGPDGATVYAVHVADGEVSSIPVSHGVDRIDAAGSGAVVLGGKGADLHVTTLRLDATGASAGAHHTLPGPGEGWRVARGAFSAGVEGASVLALTMQDFTHPGAPFPTVGSARIALLRDDGSRLEPLGEVASTAPDRDDGCLADCGLWFENVRPLFAGGRILGLMGYELVEASAAGGRLREVRRVAFTPVEPTVTLAGDWEFTESLGPQGSPYRCRNVGTMRLERDGQALTLRYRQTGVCAVNGIASPSDGEGSGTGTVVGGTYFTLAVNGCTYRARMRHADAFVAHVSCPVNLPGQDRGTVEGSVDGRRVHP